MNLTTDSLKKEKNLNINKSAPKYELPFVKMAIEGKKGETLQIIRKLNNSKKHINDHYDKLLYQGFNGSLEDFYKLYGKKEIIIRKKPKGKIKLSSSLLLKSDLLSKPIQKTIMKEFNFMNKQKEKRMNMKTLLNLITIKDNFKKINMEKNKDKHRNKSAFDINSENITNLKSDFYKTSLVQKNTNNDITDNEKKMNYYKMKKIKNIRKLLNEKSRNILKKEENIDFQKSTFETILENQENNEKDQKKEKREKNGKKNEKSPKNYTKLNRIEIIRAIMEKSEKKKKKNNISKNINETFNKLLNEKEDDKIQFQKILDPLANGFKAHLKEVKINEGRDKYNIWIKKSTANIVSFGNSFQLMADDAFYKDHKRIISKYPDIEREANILVPELKTREDNKIIERLENNDRKIRNIINDNDNLLKVIKNKYLNERKIKYSKSQPLLRQNKKILLIREKF